MTRTCSPVDCLAVNQTLRDGETLVSASGITEEGFFSPGNSTRRYLGIWYRNVSPFTGVWVANRNIPLENKSGVLKLNEKGILVLLNATNSTIWLSNKSNTAVNDPVVQPLDLGNLIVKTGQDSFLWQSFGHPCDTFVPGMKLGRNLETGLETYVSSWRSADDAAEGEYTVKIDLRGYPQAVMLEESVIKIGTGPRNGVSWAGYPGPIPKTSQIFVFNEKEVHYELELLDRLVFRFL
ncbi:G-type lectin S-receptor serine/threonine-protein kinase [Spatholobus suberectus]|nr:G-type lectin S-receptor serine/threonine-protein kinase [Spatholobus suberectus]